MGCGSSTPRTSPAHKGPAAPPPAPTPEQIVGELTGVMRTHLETILQGVSYIPKLKDAVPVVAFGKSGFPVVPAPLVLDAGDATGLDLSFACASIAGPASRIIGIGHLVLLELCEKESEGSVFLENSLRWAALETHGSVRACVFAMEPTRAQTINKNIRDCGFSSHTSNDPADLHGHNIIVCGSDCSYTAEIRERILQGVSVVCAAVPGKFGMNSVLSEFGIGFPECTLMLGPFGVAKIKIDSRSPHLVPFQRICLDCAALVQKPMDSVPILEIDTLVATLRYYLSVMPRGPDEVLEYLADAIFEALVQSNYIDDEDMFCPTTFHGVLMVLLHDVLQKVPAQYFIGKDNSELFPGRVTGQEVVSQTVTLAPNVEAWHSTGFYVRPGEVGHCKVVSGTLMPRTTIQIGAHVDVLVNKPGPWLRWPFIASSFAFAENEVDFASMFGGIIYLRAPPSAELELEFSGVVKYPLFSRGSWNGTEIYAAPFAEIVTDYAVFTLPSSYLEQITDLAKASTVLDDLFESVVHFTGDTSESKFRIVFDVELATEFPVCGNPIVFTYDQIVPLLQRQRPCADLYCLLMFAAVLTLPPGGFDEEDEACVAAVAAAAAFQKKWSKVSPFNFAPQHLPERSKQLWSIYQKPGGEKAMIRALSRAQEAMEGESMWSIFLTELRNLANIPPDYFADQEGPKIAGQAVAVVPDASPLLNGFQLDPQTLALSK